MQFAHLVVFEPQLKFCHALIVHPRGTCGGVIPIPFPPYPLTPQPVTYAEDANIPASTLRSDVDNATLLLTQPPLFVGTQTGSPTPFVAAAGSGATITTAGAGYSAGQPLVLSGSIPSPLSGGTTYYASGVSGQLFGLATTSSGSAVTLTSGGFGTATSIQFLVSGSVPTALNIDTTVTDPWAGHLTTSNIPTYYAIFPGYYLCEMQAPLEYTGGTGCVSVAIEGQEGVGPQTTYGGQCMPNSATSSRYPQPSVAKLLAFSVAGSYGAPANNYVQGAVYQDSGSQQQALITTTRFPQIQVQWVAALTGTAGLPVPDNDTWAAPPQVVSSTFVNKNIRDTINFLSYVPICEAYYSAGTQTLASQSGLPGGGSTVSLDTAYIDTYSAFNATTHTWTAPVPGTYLCYGQAPVTGGSGAVSVDCGLTVHSKNYNGGTVITVWGGAQVASTSASQVNCGNVRRLLRLNAGDTVQLAAYQNGATNPVLPSAGIWQSRLITIWRTG